MAAIAAFAVPQARTTILKWFHLRGVTVERVETLPPAVERSQASGLGRPLSRAEAERAVGFRLALPPLAHEPSRVYVVGDALASVMLRAEGRSILLSEFRGVELRPAEEVRRGDDGRRARQRERRPGPLAGGLPAYAHVHRPPRSVPAEARC